MMGRTVNLIIGLACKDSHQDVLILQQPTKQGCQQNAVKIRDSSGFLKVSHFQPTACLRDRLLAFLFQKNEKLTDQVNYTDNFLHCSEQRIKDFQEQKGEQVYRCLTTIRIWIVLMFFSSMRFSLASEIKIPNLIYSPFEKFKTRFFSK